MPEQVGTWWARRQWSKGDDVPYAVGQFRGDWERYPVLIRQYHPDLNSGVTLTQIPPAADVWLLWQCDVGHQFVATPWEQRQRPGRSRRRSTWCPECAAGAVVRRVVDRTSRSPVASSSRPAKSGGPGKPGKPAKPLCHKSEAERVDVGQAFRSGCAPRVASAVEAKLRMLLSDRLEFDDAHNAVRIARPFFNHLEVWPDLALADLRVAIEYDTTGRDGLEHVGQREAIDLRKDRMLRQVGWEVIRIRGGKLHPLGPWDINGAHVSRALVDRLIDRLREVRGDLIVDCYLR